jgi:hypothetical protein
VASVASEETGLQEVTNTGGILVVTGDVYTAFSETPVLAWDGSGETTGSRGLVFTSGVPVCLVPTTYATSYANCLQAMMFRSCRGAIDELIKGRCNDCHNCANDDPFVAVLGGHEHRSVETTTGFGATADFGGISVGEDRVLPAGRGFVRFGGTASYLANRIKFSGPSSGLAKRTTTNYFFGDLFAAYERRDRNHLKGNIFGACGVQHGSNRLSRVDSDKAAFSARCHDTGVHVELGAAKNLFRKAALQAGPRLALAYDWIDQGGYGENGGTGAASINSLRLNLFHTDLGLGFENEVAPPAEHPRRQFRCNGQISWRCRVGQWHSSALGSIAGESYGAFSPTLAYGKRHAIALGGGFRSRFNEHWELRGNLKSTITGGATGVNASVTAGYTF